MVVARWLALFRYVCSDRNAPAYPKRDASNGSWCFVGFLPWFFSCLLLPFFFSFGAFPLRSSGFSPSVVRRALLYGLKCCTGRRLSLGRFPSSQVWNEFGSCARPSPATSFSNLRPDFFSSRPPPFSLERSLPFFSCSVYLVRFQLRFPRFFRTLTPSPWKFRRLL